MARPTKQLEDADGHLRGWESQEDEPSDYAFGDVDFCPPSGSLSSCVCVAYSMMTIPIHAAPPNRLVEILYLLFLSVVILKT